MIAVNIQTVRSSIPALLEMLDTMDSSWRFYNTYEDEPADDERHRRVRQANEEFIQVSIANGSGNYSATLTVCTTPRAAMLLRLSWPETHIMDLREIKDNSSSTT